VVFVRLGVRRIHGTLVDALDLTGGGAEAPPRDALDRLDAACVARLERLRASISARVDACADGPQERWRLRHLLPRLAQIGEMLESAPAACVGLAASLARADEARVRELGAARVLPAAAGGLELLPLVGGKAAHLGEIARALGEGAVPPWFTVTDTAFREVLSIPVPATTLAALGLGASGRLEDAIAEVTAHAAWDARRQANAIRELWQAILLPAGLAAEIAAAYGSLAAPGDGEPPVAIRSSSREEDREDAAWAGQFDTFLFVRGVEAVLEHVKLAWAGFWTERAIDQRLIRAAPPLTSGGGIVVQRMVPARASGVLHTVCASTGQLREMVVNAGLGLGEGVVSGTVDVDHVLVAKADLASGDLRVQYRVGDKREQIVWDRERGTGTRREETRYHQRLRPALEYVELHELVSAAARLEEAFVEPLDVEFAIEGRELRILQARPMPIFDAAWREALARHPLRLPGASREKEAP
jgi:pyruvate,water dikinase